MKCYFQNCPKEAKTKEHVPPKAFFPKDQRKNLITVRSCNDHNNQKSGNDLYVLAQICLNSSPRNRAREVFMKSIVPQLGFNNESLRKYLAQDLELLENGVVKYRVDVARMDNFFNALSCGLIFHIAKDQLPQIYSMSNIYHNLIDETLSSKEIKLRKTIEEFYERKTPKILNFGRAQLENKDIYTAKIFGIKDFKSSITIVHIFFGRFKVTSMLSNHYY